MPFTQGFSALPRVSEAFTPIITINTHIQTRTTAKQMKNNKTKPRKDLQKQKTHSLSIPTKTKPRRWTKKFTRTSQILTLSQYIINAPRTPHFHTIPKNPYHKIYNANAYSINELSHLQICLTMLKARNEKETSFETPTLVQAMVRIVVLELP